MQKLLASFARFQKSVRFDRPALAFSSSSLQVCINKGVRQGDPLSLYLFLLAVELLVSAVNNETRIEGLGKGRKRNVKGPSYADDLTMTLIGSSSVCLAFEIIQRFSEATGLKLNIEKTQDMMVGFSCTGNRLP